MVIVMLTLKNERDQTS